MKFKKYLFDQLPQIAVFMFCYIIIFLLLKVFRIDHELTLAVIFIFIFQFLFMIFYDYFKKQSFYKELNETLNQLDQKYLVLEMISKPNFYEGELFYDTLYQINKSMIENVKEYSLSITDFKEYVEMWIHEVKIPISSLVLLNHNSDHSFDKRYIEPIKKLDHYIDQILYYVRSENTEKDYFIKETKLEEMIKNVALKNKDDLLQNKIDLKVTIKKETVLTDSKWLEFILNQIINNSIKYKKNHVTSLIQISSKKEKDKIYLSIYDNGKGIPSSDLPRVFDKSFTGTNGRNSVKSTGMGLYIVQKLCTKLGHKISIESKEGEYTKVTITFYQNDFYKMKE